LKKFLVILSIIVVLVLICLYIIGGTIMNKPLISEKEIVLGYKGTSENLTEVFRGSHNKYGLFFIKK